MSERHLSCWPTATGWPSAVPAGQRLAGRPTVATERMCHTEAAEPHMAVYIVGKGRGSRIGYRHVPPALSELTQSARCWKAWHQAGRPSAQTFCEWLLFAVAMPQQEDLRPAADKPSRPGVGRDTYTSPGNQCCDGHDKFCLPDTTHKQAGTHHCTAPSWMAPPCPSPAR